MPAFLYFDLGNVLIDFDVELMFRQMGAVAGLAPATVKEVVIHSGLQRQYEAGRLSTQEFYEGFCRQTGTRADFEALAKANREMFFLNETVERLIRGLHRAGMRLGVLSNTNPNHWEYCWQEFPVLRECFAVYALSYRAGACKPEAAIFRAAAEMAGCPPGEIFFTDDIAEHVAAAKALGFDALQFVGAAQLVADLQQRGVAFGG